MPWRLIGFILIFALFLAFIAFNLGNSCDISFGFRVFGAVPVYLTAFSSFVLGMLCAIPFMVSLGFRKNRDSGRKIAGGKKKGGKNAEAANTGLSAELTEKGGPYGID